MRPAKPAITTTGSVAGRVSLCHEFLPAISTGAALSAKRIHQDLVREHGFAGSYESVKRHVRQLVAALELSYRGIECSPGEEMQVDFGQGSWVEAAGKRRRPHLFRAVLEEDRRRGAGLQRAADFSSSLQSRCPSTSTNTPMSTSAPLNMETLFKLRAIVARFGELDLAKWWNTKGQLGRLGAAALKRGFPRTYRFAQARSVFAVAANRCAEVFEPPGCVTLWRLPEDIEEEFDARWEHWLDNAGEWTAFFEKLETISGSDLTTILRAFEVVSDRDLDAYGRLRRSAEGRAVPLPGLFSSGDADVALLALGFARGEPSALAVPYARRTDA